MEQFWFALADCIVPLVSLIGVFAVIITAMILKASKKK